jgi:hypothetical protein
LRQNNIAPKTAPLKGEQMNLRNFITQCLSDIVGGVQDAQKITDDDTSIPSVVKNFKAVTTGISELQTIDFEVCVRTEERKGSYLLSRQAGQSTHLAKHIFIINALGLTTQAEACGYQDKSY